MAALSHLGNNKSEGSMKWFPALRLFLKVDRYHFTLTDNKL